MAEPAILDLGGAEWSLGQVRAQPLHFQGNDRLDVAEWLPAHVPGNVRADLLAAGRIPDPFVGRQLAASEWVDDHDWWVRRRVALPLEPGQRAFVRFAGIDYLSAVFAGDECLGRHEGMFSEQIYELTDHLRCEPEFDLAVRIWGSDKLPGLQLSAGQRIGRELARLLHMAELPHPDRLATLKCPMSYGWDFAPRLLAMGIWDEVSLALCDTAAIMDMWPRVEWPESVSWPPASVDVHLTLDVDSAREMPALLALHVEGDNFACAGQEFDFSLNLLPGRRTHTLSFTLESPALWQPWDRGEPNLYRLRAGLRDAAAGRLLDRRETSFGMRRVHLSPSWRWEINGEREFIRGVNWVPADSLPGRLRADDYEQLVGAARAAGVNLLRVWGGGLREKRSFYETCDRAGISVWQEFPLACVFFGRLPRSARYLALARQESQAIVRALRAHPSVVVWCGGNEFSPTRNRAVVEVLRESVATLDGTRPFLPASPWRGDHHNWDIWHGFAPAGDYRHDDAHFASEFGLQAAAPVDTLRQCLAADDLWPAGDGWAGHHAQLEKLRHYAGMSTPDDLESFVEATQRAQARALQIAIEHFRRRKGACGGLAIWQWNEPWPAISWSLIDYYRRPKLAGRRLGRWFDPLLVSLDYPLKRYVQGDRLDADVWIVNDWQREFRECEIRVGQGGRPLWATQVDVAPDESRRMERIVLSDIDPDLPLDVELWNSTGRLAHNDYDLTYHDTQRGMPFRQRLRRWMADWLIRR